MTILAVDFGTTALKMGVYSGENEADLELRATFSQDYAINTYNDGLYGDIEPEKWKSACIAGSHSASLFRSAASAGTSRSPPQN